MGVVARARERAREREKGRIRRAEIPCTAISTAYNSQRGVGSECREISLQLRSAQLVCVEGLMIVCSSVLRSGLLRQGAVVASNRGGQGLGEDDVSLLGGAEDDPGSPNGLGNDVEDGKGQDLLVSSELAERKERVQVRRSKLSASIDARQWPREVFHAFYSPCQFPR